MENRDFNFISKLKSPWILNLPLMKARAPSSSSRQTASQTSAGVLMATPGPITLAHQRLAARESSFLGFNSMAFISQAERQMPQP